MTTALVSFDSSASSLFAISCAVPSSRAFWMVCFCLRVLRLQKGGLDSTTLPLKGTGL